MHRRERQGARHRGRTPAGQRKLSRPPDAPLTTARTERRRAPDRGRPATSFELPGRCSPTRRARSAGVHRSASGRPSRWTCRDGADAEATSLGLRPWTHHVPPSRAAIERRADSHRTTARSEVDPASDRATRARTPSGSARIRRASHPGDDGGDRPGPRTTLAPTNERPVAHAGLGAGTAAGRGTTASTRTDSDEPTRPIRTEVRPDGEPLRHACRRSKSSASAAAARTPSTA